MRGVHNSFVVVKLDLTRFSGQLISFRERRVKSKMGRKRSYPTAFRQQMVALVRSEFGNSI